MSGKCDHTAVSGISVGGDTITSRVDIVSALGTDFCIYFYSDNYDPSFKLLKDDADALSQNFSSWLAGPYKVKFSMDELVTASHCYCTMSPSLNSIHNQMPSHLPPTSKEFQLSIYNHIWSENLSQLPRQVLCYM
jgi:hypothetical protein